MESKLNNALAFHAVETRTSKAGNQYSVVLLRDNAKFEEFQFFKQDDLVMDNNLQMGETVDCEFELEKRGFNININLKSVKKQKKVGQ